MIVGGSLLVRDEDDGGEDVCYAVWAWVSNRGRARYDERRWCCGSECGNEYRDAVGREAGASVDELGRSLTSDRTDGRREAQRLERMAMLLLPLPSISAMNEDAGSSD